MKRLLITGASGGLGTLCRERLTHLADILRLSSNTDMGDAAPHEEIMLCDLADKDGVAEIVKDCDGIVHLGGHAVEAPWDVIRAANIDGVYHLYEAARQHGVNRILFASSNHAIGFHDQTTRLDANSPVRPDGLYGVSKVFGEAMARMYYDKFGIETASVRIGSCFPEPRDHRMLSSWLSYDDFIRLIERVFVVPRLGCPIIYGCSNNQAVWWDNHETAFLGWKPQDSSEVFRAKIDAAMDRPDRDDPLARYQGGMFCVDGIHES